MVPKCRGHRGRRSIFGAFMRSPSPRALSNKTPSAGANKRKTIYRLPRLHILSLLLCLFLFPLLPLTCGYLSTLSSTDHRTDAAATNVTRHRHLRSHVAIAGACHHMPQRSLTPPLSSRTNTHARCLSPDTKLKLQVAHDAKQSTACTRPAVFSRGGGNPPTPKTLQKAA